MKTSLIVILALLSAGAVSTVFFNNIHKSRQTDANVVRISGNIEVTDAQVSFKIPGRVEERAINEGDTIKAGQLVAQLDSTELAQEVALRNADVRATHAALAELLAGYLPEEISQAVFALKRAEAEAHRAKMDYERRANLYSEKVISTHDYETVKAAYEVANTKVREAQEQLSLLKKGPRKERIDAANARLDQAQKALDLAETRLSCAKLSSPLSGIVLSKHIEPGEYVAPGTPIVIVGDIENVWLRGYINETDLGRVKLGQKVYVTTDTFPGKRYEGRVSFISPQAEFTPKSVQTKQERVKLVYRVKVDIHNPLMELKPGMPADAQILTSHSAGRTN